MPIATPYLPCFKEARVAFLPLDLLDVTLFTHTAYIRNLNNMYHYLGIIYWCTLVTISV